ncbi:NAD(P)/FAD-dependent oxidoreductase [Candidatus Woesearchaeota archaeon]|nr:NAD(P)/FAD-dependent oxidoreductase [Candidatus Woesearchaeota archaeon]
MNISIIGAGPIGCYCGYLLAKAGQRIDIYEEHAEIGLPIQCTGLLTSDFDQFGLPKESFLVNTFGEIEINSPNKQLTIKQKEYLIDRSKFDGFLAELAKKAGAKIYLQHAFARKENEGLVIKDTKNDKEIAVTPDAVIAADGPLSKTAHAFGLYPADRVSYQGVQAVVEGKFDLNKYQTFFGNKVCPDLFAWIVPESRSRARVGLASTKDARKLFDQFVLERDFKILEIQAGMIPLYHPKQKLQGGNCYLAGDASGFIKATTLGGLVPGLKQAELLANSIIESKNYEKEVKQLRKKMNFHLRLRKIFNKFSDEDWDKLLSLLNRPKIQRLLERYTRENPLPLVVKALITEPKLWYFSKFLF